MSAEDRFRIAQFAELIKRSCTGIVNFIIFLQRLQQSHMVPQLWFWSSVQIMELPAVCRTQPITIGQQFFNNSCYKYYMVKHCSMVNNKCTFQFFDEVPQLCIMKYSMFIYYYYSLTCLFCLLALLWTIVKNFDKQI